MLDSTPVEPCRRATLNDHRLDPLTAHRHPHPHTSTGK
jgi:hypothetical protein